MKIRIVLLVLLISVLTACGGDRRGGSEIDKTEIRATLEQYLPIMAAAYASGDVAPLNTYAAEREVATVQKRIKEVRVRGERLEPTFRSLTIEKVTAWGYSNAYATTLEVWDLRLYASHGENPVVETLEQRSRVKYQLRREDDHWIVLYRELIQAFD
jgi:hypothetical protein